MKCTYRNRFNDTFIYYKPNETTSLSTKENLSTITSRAVELEADRSYKTRSEAISEGFDVNWYASYISNQCTRTYSVTNVDTNVTSYNQCGYGIVYEVTWEILY